MVYLRSPVVCFLLSVNEMSCITKDKPYADIRKKKKQSKSCHHQVPAHQKDRKEASGLVNKKPAPVLMTSVRWSTSTLSLQLKSPAELSILHMR